MKKIMTEVPIYKCEYCGATESSLSWMEEHEVEHHKVDELLIGQRVIYNFDQGYTREGTVIRKDVLKSRFLVETIDGERDWTTFYQVRELLPNPPKEN